jgi:hypothetical protein
LELPVRIVRGARAEPVIACDGACDSVGLNLSHWPGHRTPPELRHDLSTGSGLAFARLDPARRRELARGCVEIANNHYDTDGTCSLFAVKRPEVALAHEQELLEAARAGDLYQMPSERAFCVDQIVGELVEPRSPLSKGFAGLDDLARHQLATDFLMEELPALLRGDLAPYRALFEEELEATRRDRAELARASRDDVVHLDWTAWISKPDSFAAGDPGRHALFGSTPHDRVLVALPGSSGTRYRLLFSTLSWFDLVTRTALPRPDLAALAAELNALEGASGSDAAAWRAQDASSPTPELWFGSRDHELFAERCPALRPSRLPPATVRRTIADALRSALLLPT